MKQYSTQMDAARKGLLTKEMKQVAQIENIDPNTLLSAIAQGTIIIPANKNHLNLIPAGIGAGLKTKINVNLGISKDCRDINKEIEKVKYALELKSDAIMDLSCFGRTSDFRQKLIEISTAMIGSVPIYDVIGFHEKALEDISVDDIFEVVETHAKDGVDFITIHAGLTQSVAQKINTKKRLTNIVSRGGSLLFSWMAFHDCENPFYANFDRLLAICQEHDVTLSLGDGCRPGSIHDSTDAVQIEELIVLGELTQLAWDQNIQVMIEGPGHMALNEIAANVILEKKLCHQAPFYVLGPIVTDVAPGYDHITSAIGGAIAASEGADFLCYVTPAEHLRLPDLDDMKEGIIATRIAAHAADIVKKVNGARQWDNAISQARQKLDWKKMFELAIDPEKAQNYRSSSIPEHEDTCTMCGKMCAVRTMNQIV
jgi:phosphomethylpyrimidine synthase